MTQPSDPGIQQPWPGSQPQAQAAAPAQVPAFPTAPPVAGNGYGPPGMAPAGTYLDQASGLALPQGTALASVGRRVGAYFLALPLAVVTLGIGYVIWGLIVWSNGQTPALQVLGMRCWRPETATVPGWGRMALREIVGRLVEGIIVVTEVLSFVFMVTRPDRQSLHDMIAGTVVLHDPDKVLAR